MSNRKDDERLNEFEAAQFLGISVSWLRQSRTKNPKWAGPTFIKRDGWRVEYRRRDLIACRNNRTRNTCVIHPAKRMRANA